MNNVSNLNIFLGFFQTNLKSKQYLFIFFFILCITLKILVALYFNFS